MTLDQLLTHWRDLGEAFARLGAPEEELHEELLAQDCTSWQFTQAVWSYRQERRRIEKRALPRV